MGLSLECPLRYLKRILQYILFFSCSKLPNTGCYIKFAIFHCIYIYITILFICTLFAEMFFMFLHKRKKQLPHYFSSLIIQFHYCNLRSLFLICPHNCSKKKRLHHVFICFHQFLKMFVILLFLLHFRWDKTRLHVFSAIDSFGSYFLVIVFIFFAHVQMFKKTRLHHLFHIVLKMLIVVFSVLFTFLLRCVAKKKRGYTFVGPNAKKCVIHGHSMF